jgi:hypothetical protein
MKSNDRFKVFSPAGRARSGKFCWWVVRDTSVDLRVHGNNITDYFYDGYPDAKERAQKRADELNALPPKKVEYGVNHPATHAEFMELYEAAA